MLEIKNENGYAKIKLLRKELSKYLNEKKNKDDALILLWKIIDLRE